jgi:hypothetical protein
MAYFQELSEELQYELLNILINRIKKDKKHRKIAKELSMDLDDYAFEIADDIINRHNWDLTIKEWFDLVETVDLV